MIKNGASAPHIEDLLKAQQSIICKKLLHLERRSHDDAVQVSKSVIELIFRRFVGKRPNYRPSNDKHYNKEDGVELADNGKIRNSFTAIAALDWLSDFTTVLNKDEGAEICGHFVRFGLISLISDKVSRNGDTWIYRVTAAGNGAGGALEAEFRISPKALYGVTDLGRVIARWDKSHASANVNATPGSSSSLSPSPNLSSAGSPATPIHASRTVGDAAAEREEARVHDEVHIVLTGPKDSNAARLKQILEEPALRALFREFLRESFCEENVSRLSHSIVSDLLKLLLQVILLARRARLQKTIQHHFLCSRRCAGCQ